MSEEPPIANGNERLSAVPRDEYGPVRDRPPDNLQGRLQQVPSREFSASEGRWRYHLQSISDTDPLGSMRGSSEMPATTMGISLAAWGDTGVQEEKSRLDRNQLEGLTLEEPTMEVDDGDGIFDDAPDNGGEHDIASDNMLPPRLCHKRTL